MPTSSRYIQLSSSVLMEYIYADQTSLNTPGNEYQLSTTTNPIWLMQNGHTNVPQILNADSAEIIQTGLPLGTGNVRNRTFATIKPYEGALLDIDKLTYYNDYDPLLTPTSSLPISFTNPQAPVYDTIRLHLVQGFNFEMNDGLNLSIEIRRKDGKLINLLNWVYNKSDTWETLNPSPFFFGGRVYNSYIEVRVLALYNLIYEYWLGTLTSDSVVLKISNGLGLERDQLIQIKFSWIKNKKTVDGQDYIFFYDGKSVDIPVRDQFETISAVIQESTGGDYIEFYGAYNGQIIENFILDLNSSGYDFILLHDLTVSEYVWDGTSSYNWIVTDTLQISQTSDYDLPNLYRPIIKNNSAISYKIDYVVRLYNRIDNTQIWKTASLISNSAAKYGRKLMSINLGTNPIQTKIYNQNVVKDITINRISEPVLDNSKYITSFLSNNSISISYENFNSIPQTRTTVPQGNEKALGTNSGSNPVIYENGLGIIAIPNNTAYLKFNVYQKRNNVNAALNLSGIGDFLLVFTSNEGESVIIQEFPSTFISKTSGEIIFRITSVEANNILGFENKNFSIFLRSDKGEETFIYGGRFFSINDYQEMLRKDALVLANKKISDLTSALLISQNQLNQQTFTINSLISQNQALSSDDEQDANQIANLQSIVNNLNQQIASQSAQLAIAIAAVQSGSGLPQSTDLINQTLDFAAANESTQQSNVEGKPVTQSYQESEIQGNQININTQTGSNFSTQSETR